MNLSLFLLLMCFWQHANSFQPPPETLGLQGSTKNQTVNGILLRNAYSDSNESIERSSLKSRKKRSMSNTNIFAVEPDEVVICTKQDSGVFPSTHKNVVVGNIGLQDIEVETIYGLKYPVDIGPIERFTLKPGERHTSQLLRPFYTTAVKVKNLRKTRAFFYSYIEGHEKGFASHGSETSSSDIDFQAQAIKGLRLLVLAGSKQVPYIGPVLSPVIGVFWPEKKPNAWEEVRDKVKSLMSEVELNIVNGIINDKLSEFRNRIGTLLREVDNFDVGAHYMNIAEDMIGLDGKFVYTGITPVNSNFNFHTLPLFSRTVNLKLSFYTWGITFAKRIGLTNDALNRLILYRRQTVDEAAKYLYNLQLEQYRMVYNSCKPENLYNDMMKVRTFITVNGLEYLPYWKNIVDPQNNTIYPEYISYSNFFGAGGFDLYNQTLDNYLDAPLTPKLIGSRQQKTMKRNTLVSIKVFGSNRFGVHGLVLHFENGDTHNLGILSGPSAVLELNGAKITKLQVGGNYCIDYVRFYLSDGRAPFDFGKHERYQFSQVFEMKNHHIVSIYASGDPKRYFNRMFYNIAVSYQLDSIKVDEFLLDRLTL